MTIYMTFNNQIAAIAWQGSVTYFENKMFVWRISSATPVFFRMLLWGLRWQGHTRQLHWRWGFSEGRIMGTGRRKTSHVAIQWQSRYAKGRWLQQGVFQREQVWTKNIRWQKISWERFTILGRYKRDKNDAPVFLVRRAAGLRWRYFKPNVGLR